MLTYLELIIAPILFVYSIYLTVKWKKASFAKRVFIIFSIGLSFLVAFNGIAKFQKEQYIEKVRNKFGDIVDGNKTTIPKIRVGNIYDFATFQYPTNKYGIFPNQNTPIMKIYAKESKVFINAILTDYKRDIIAVINDNTWKIFDDNYEYNNDNNAFEIVTKGTRRVFMHVNFENGYCYIEGFFMTEDNGFYIGVLDNHDPFMHAIYTIKNKRNDDKAKNLYLIDLKNSKIKPIFKYPREKYLGVRQLKN